ncbi:hypothetical protein BAE44_0012141 [Dichanthelium oligosanthes]|uniref:At1g61320/AtMIF1 LRR domain-containing protein n=1 Tax=Dichanthelium oligosanthes TaxID=888268 RepID=A0A1E5VNZ1_9POAL|nr:hypothetical protein BAE44_0012141 [Dichanthelium oligosanthes]
MRVVSLSEKHHGKVVETLEFAGSTLWLAEVGPCRKDLEQCRYNYLKHISITGFRAARGQLEFLLHVIENAPALEVLSVEIGQYPPFASRPHGAIKKVKQIARTNLCPILTRNVMFDV